MEARDTTIITGRTSATSTTARGTFVSALPAWGTPRDRANTRLSISNRSSRRRREEEAIEADEEAWREMPTGNGPYMMTGTWQHDVGIFTERNMDYYGQAGLPDNVEWRILSTQDAAFQQVQDGTLDIMTGIPDEQVENARIDFGDLRRPARPPAAGGLLG